MPARHRRLRDVPARLELGPHRGSVCRAETADRDPAQHRADTNEELTGLEGNDPEQEGPVDAATQAELHSAADAVRAGAVDHAAVARSAALRRVRRAHAAPGDARGISRAPGEAPRSPSGASVERAGLR